MNNDEIENGAKVMLPEVAKLNLKNLAPYLPYGLKVCIMGESINDKPIIFELVGLDTHYVEYHEIGRTVTEQAIFSDCFPVLRPISDLYKEIEHNGKKVIMLWDGEDEENDNFLIEDLDCPTEINLEGHQKYCIDLMDYGYVNTLMEYHFDVFGLIDKGLAIDINTLILTNGE